VPSLRWSAWLLLSLAAPADALDYSQVRFRSVGIEQGLSHASIQALAQDGDGYLWFGTQDGLNRYDGAGFRVLDRRFLGDAHIKALAEDEGDGLWIGTLAGGLLRLDLATYRLDRIAGRPTNGSAGWRATARSCG
jgi:ligand-binding sensor domain-containing protein